MHELEFELASESQPFNTLIATTNWITAGRAITRVFKCKNTGVERIEQKVISIHRKWHRDRSKYRKAH